MRPEKGGTVQEAEPHHQKGERNGERPLHPAGGSSEEQLPELKREERPTAASSSTSPLPPTATRGRSSLRLLKSKVAPQESLPSAASPFAIIKALLRLGRWSPARVSAEPQPSALPPPTTVDEACRRMRVAGSSEDTDWTVRHQAMLALPSLLARLQGDDEATQRAVDALREPLTLQLADLRSAIVRTACEVLRALAAAQGASMAPLVAAVLPQLLSNRGLVRVFANASATAAAAALELAPSTAALKAAIECSKDSRKQVRQGSYELVGLLLGDQHFRIPPKGLAASFAALGQGLSDPDSGARSASARGYWAAHANYPADAEAWLAKLAERERKLIRQHQKPKASDGAQERPAAARMAAPVAAAVVPAAVPRPARSPDDEVVAAGGSSSPGSADEMLEQPGRLAGSSSCDTTTDSTSTPTAAGASADGGDEAPSAVAALARGAPGPPGPGPAHT